MRLFSRLLASIVGVLLLWSLPFSHSFAQEPVSLTQGDGPGLKSTEELKFAIGMTFKALTAQRAAEFAKRLAPSLTVKEDFEYQVMITGEQTELAQGQSLQRMLEKLDAAEVVRRERFAATASPGSVANPTRERLAEIFKLTTRARSNVALNNGKAETIVDSEELQDAVTWLMQEDQKLQSQFNTSVMALDMEVGILFEKRSALQRSNADPQGLAELDKKLGEVARESELALHKSLLLLWGPELDQRKKELWADLANLGAQLRIWEARSPDPNAARVKELKAQMSKLLKELRHIEHLAKLQAAWDFQPIPLALTPPGKPDAPREEIPSNAPPILPPVDHPVAFPGNGRIITIDLQSLRPEDALELARTLFQASGAAAGPKRIAVRVPDEETARRLQDQLSELDKRETMRLEQEKAMAADREARQQARQWEFDKQLQALEAKNTAYQDRRNSGRMTVDEARKLTTEILAEAERLQRLMSDQGIKGFASQLNEILRHHQFSQARDAEETRGQPQAGLQPVPDTQYGIPNQPVERIALPMPPDAPGTAEVNALVGQIEAMQREMLQLGVPTRENAGEIELLKSHLEGATKRYNQLIGFRNQWLEFSTALQRAKAAAGADSPIKKQRELLELERARLLGQGAARDDERIRKLDAEVAEARKKEQEAVEAAIAQSPDMQYTSVLEQRARLLAEGAAGDDERVKQLGEQITALNNTRAYEEKTPISPDGRPLVELQSNVGNPAEEAKLAQQQILTAQFQEAFLKAQAQLARQAAELEAAKKQLADAQNPLRLEMTKLEAELAVLMQTHGEGHAQVRELRSKIAALQQQLAENATQAEGGQGFQTDPRLAELQQQLRQLKLERFVLQEKGIGNPEMTLEMFDAQIADVTRQLQEGIAKTLGVPAEQIQPANHPNAQAQVTEVQKQLAESQARLAAQAAELEAARKQLEAAQNPLRLEIAKLEAELAALQQTHGNGNAQVRDIQAKINSLRSQLQEDVHTGNPVRAPDGLGSIAKNGKQPVIAISVNGRDAQQFMDSLITFFANDGDNRPALAADSQSGMLFVQGTEAQVAMIRELLEKLSGHQPPGSLSLDDLRLARIAKVHEQIAQLKAQRRITQEQGLNANLRVPLESLDSMIAQLEESLTEMGAPPGIISTLIAPAGRDGRYTVDYDAPIPPLTVAENFGSSYPNSEKIKGGTRIRIAGNKQQHEEFLKLLKAMMTVEEQRFIVIPLGKLDPLQTQNILDPFFAKDGTQRPTLVADQQGGNLFVRGTATQIALIRKVLASYGEPPAQPLQQSQMQREELRRQFQAAEAAALAQAEQLRGLKVNALEHPQAAKLREEVTKAFEARQAQQQAEVQALQARLKEIQQSVETRAKNKQQIIDRRVQELLNPNLKWETSRKALDEPAANVAMAKTAPLPFDSLLGLWKLSKNAGGSSKDIPDYIAIGPEETIYVREAKPFQQHGFLWRGNYAKDMIDFGGRLLNVVRPGPDEQGPVQILFYQADQTNLQVVGLWGKSLVPLATYTRQAPEIPPEIASLHAQPGTNLSHANIWGLAMTPVPSFPETVLGAPSNAAPANELLGLWEYENTPESDYGFLPPGSLKQLAFAENTVMWIVGPTSAHTDAYFYAADNGLQGKLKLYSPPHENGGAFHFEINGDHLKIRGENEKKLMTYRRVSRELSPDLLARINRATDELTAKSQNPPSAAPPSSSNVDPELLGVWETVQTSPESTMQYVITPTKYAEIYEGKVLGRYSLRTSRLTEGNRIAELFGADGKTLHIIKYEVEGNTLRWTLPAVDGTPEHACHFKRISATVGPAYEKLLAEATGSPPVPIVQGPTVPPQETLYGLWKLKPPVEPNAQVPQNTPQYIFIQRDSLAYITSGQREGSLRYLWKGKWGVQYMNYGTHLAADVRPIIEEPGMIANIHIVQMDQDTLQVRSSDGKELVTLASYARESNKLPVDNEALQWSPPVSSHANIWGKPLVPGTDELFNPGFLPVYPQNPQPVEVIPPATQLAAGGPAMDILAITNQATSFRMSFQKLAAEIPNLQPVEQTARRKEFEALKDQYGAMLSLVKLRVTQAERDVLRAQQERERMEKLAKAQAATAEEVREKEHTLQETMGQLEMARQVLDLLNKAAPPEIVAAAPPGENRTAAEQAAFNRFRLLDSNRDDLVSPEELGQSNAITTQFRNAKIDISVPMTREEFILNFILTAQPKPPVPAPGAEGNAQMIPKGMRALTINVAADQARFAPDDVVSIVEDHEFVEGDKVVRRGTILVKDAQIFATRVDGEPGKVSLLLTPDQVPLVVQATQRGPLRLVQLMNQPEPGTSPFAALSDSDNRPQVRISLDNAKRIMLALHLYHDKHGHFPPAVVMNQAGTVPHSWRVEILPHMGQAEQSLFAEYLVDEPWDSNHNRTLLEKMPDWYRAPGDDPKSVNASYFGLGNPVPNPYYGDKRRVTLFNGPAGAKISDARDGTSNALAVVECKRDIPWTKPEDIDYSTSKPVPPLGGWHKDAFIGGRVDGAALVYSGSNDEATLRKLIEIDDGQPVKPVIVEIK